MNRATTILVVLALASAGGAWSMRPQELPALPDLETGQLLFEKFTDPTAAASLEVTSYDKDSARVVGFSVEQKGGLWVIPSHNDYPADGTERMGKAAASFIGIKKDKQYGDRPEDHAAFGVLDPSAAEGEPDQKGQRIKISDASGAALVDIIVGKAVPGQQGMFYVRYPEGKRVYGARLELDISTTFSDWIEKDLLHVDRDEIVEVSYDPYSVDEQQGKVVNTDPIVARRDQTDDAAGGGSWIAAPQTRIPSGKELDGMKVKQIATSIANIKIVGVRPRPEQLTLMDLQSKGFFVAQGGAQPRLFGNEGQASITTKDGLVYTLYFGEITYETGIALTAGVADGEAETDQGADAEGDAAAEDGATKTASRYMWVDVAYNPGADTTLAENSLAPAESEASEGEAEPAADPEDEAKKVQGAERALKLRQRFDKWYYVISDTSFTQIHKNRDELFKEPKTDD